MRHAAKSLLGAHVLVATFLLTACSGLPPGTGSVAANGPITIGGTVTGLTGAGLVLLDNGGDNLTVNAAGPFAFATVVAKGGAYAVTVASQPTSPVQSCAVTGGTGAAAAKVTTVAVVCTTPAANATIGVTIAAVTGTGLVLQDNGGDSLTISKSGSYTFKAPVTGAYAVTVLTQPINPTQLCSVANGSGTAAANVTNITVTCVLSYTIGGNVNGVVGTGLILQDNGGDNLAVTINGAFTFKNQLPIATAYAVTVFAEPTGPAQTCVIAPGTDSGTTSAKPGNVTSVVINCPAVTFNVGGNVVGLAGRPATPPSAINLPLNDNSFLLQNNLGNTLSISQNEPFHFATQEALNDQFEVSVFHGSSAQFGGCTLWNYKGVVSASITSIIVDCGYNDWTWIDGKKTAGVVSPPTPQYGAFPSSAPTTPANPLTNTPGARYGAAGWTDRFGNLFLFGGTGWELAGGVPPDTLNAPMNDLWVCVMIGGDFCEWQLVGGYDPTVISGPNTVGTAIIANAQHEGQGGIYGGLTAVPGGRLGSATWTDTSGNFWLFGGSNGLHFYNDLWKYDTSALTGINYKTSEGQWVVVSGNATVDQPGNYLSGTLVPGARTNAVTWTDSLGNFWLFGGFGYDGQTPKVLGFLNDLWEYTAGHWVFVSGGNTNKANQNGIYGTQGTAAAANMPGGRQEAVGWADANGNLWLFGGEGQDSVSTAFGILNDLWMYNTVSGWTFVAGSTSANQTGTYPAQPVVGAANATGAAGSCGLAVGDPAIPCSPVSLTGAFPGSRWGASGWADGSGNLWLFGGWGLDSTGTNGNGALNDLWVYTPNSTAGQLGTWAWIKGSNTGAQNGVYGPQTIPYATYELWTPGGRSNGTHWVDQNKQFWLFGGAGYDSTSTTGNGYLNDMWRYLPYP